MKSIAALDMLIDWNIQRELVGEKFLNRWANVKYEFCELDSQEIENAYLRVLHLFDSVVTKSGKHRINEWERGWEENLSAYMATGDIENLLPKYFDKISIMRIRGEWVKPITPNLELQMLSELIDASTSCYFKDLTNIFEFGCGTGHNLLRLRNIFPTANLVGLDWTKASQNIVGKVANHLGDDLLHGLNFDFFNPDAEVKIEANSGAITVAALEQIGESHRDFTDFLLNSDVEVVINIEPIGEVLSDDILLESISKRYFKKRNYLSGYLDRLRELEVQGRIEILHVNRAFFGSFYIEGYTSIVWKPVRK
jgi:SAM-dependent methyltransferase